MLLHELHRCYDTQTGRIELSGWVRNIRVSKNLGFIEFNDGTDFKNLQIVFENNIDNFNDVSKMNVGAAIKVAGSIVLTPDARQPFELHADSIVIEGESSPLYPLQKKRHGFEFLRTIPHLRPRTNTFSAVFRTRSVVAQAIHSFFAERGFVYIHTPIITDNDGEGAGALFTVTTLEGKEGYDYNDDFFGKRAYLAVTGQLEAEAMAMAFRNVYTFGPTFRAENSNTRIHAAEFWMIEPEMAFCDLDGDMAVAEDMLKYIINYATSRLPDEFNFFNDKIDPHLNAKLENVAVSDFGRITYTDAMRELEKHNSEFEYKVKWGDDLQTEHNRYITDVMFNKPVFVTDYPKDIKAFYMRLNDDGETVAAADLLVPYVGELIGGSQREERVDVLESRIQEFGIDKESLKWYIDLRRFGGNIHSGYGLGFERALMYLTGMQNIRDVSLFPRTVGNI